MDPRVLVTGSSSLSLAGGTREALTGRTWSYTLYPIAFTELRAYEFKLSGQAAKPPQSFSQAYPDARFHTVHMENWLEFVA